MKHIGHISIRDSEINFVYHELPEPKSNNFNDCYGYATLKSSIKYMKEKREYEASKQEVKVSNIVNRIGDYWIFMGNTHAFGKKVKNNQPCEAKVENGIAIITKIV